MVPEQEGTLINKTSFSKMSTEPANKLHQQNAAGVEKKARPSRFAVCVAGSTGSPNGSINGGGYITLDTVLGNASLAQSFERRLSKAMITNLEIQMANIYEDMLRRCKTSRNSHKRAKQQIGTAQRQRLATPSELAEQIIRESQEHFGQMGAQSAAAQQYDALRVRWGNRNQWSKSQASQVLTEFRKARQELHGRDAELADIFQLIARFAYDPLSFQRAPLIFAIIGPRGSGKMALAERLGHFLILAGILVGDGEVITIGPTDLVADTEKDTRTKIETLIAESSGKLLLLRDKPLTRQEAPAALPPSWLRLGRIALQSLRKGLAKRPAAPALVVTTNGDSVPPKVFGVRYGLEDCIQYALLPPMSYANLCAVVKDRLTKDYKIRPDDAARAMASLSADDKLAIRNGSLHEAIGLAQQIAERKLGRNGATSTSNNRQRRSK